MVIRQENRVISLKFGIYFPVEFDSKCNVQVTVIKQLRTLNRFTGKTILHEINVFRASWWLDFKMKSVLFAHLIHS